MSFDTNRFTQKSQEAIVTAQYLAERNGNSQVEPEHLLLALLEQADGVVPQVLGKMLVKAHDELSQFGDAYVSTEHLLLSILAHAGGAAQRILQQAGITRDNL